MFSMPDLNIVGDLRHPMGGEVEAAAFSANNKLVAVVKDRAVAVWNVKQHAGAPAVVIHADKTSLPKPLRFRRCGCVRGPSPWRALAGHGTVVTCAMATSRRLGLRVGQVRVADRHEPGAGDGSDQRARSPLHGGNVAYGRHARTRGVTHAGCRVSLGSEVWRPWPRMQAVVEGKACTALTALRGGGMSMQSSLCAAGSELAGVVGLGFGDGKRGSVDLATLAVRACPHAAGVGVGGGGGKEGARSSLC